MTTTDGRTTPARRGVALSNRPFRLMLRAGLRMSLLSGPIAVVVLWILRGNEGAWSAALGVLVAVGFFASGLWLMDKMVGENAMALMAGAMAIYFGQVIFLGAILFGLMDATWLDGKAFGLAVIVVTLAWQVAQVVTFVKLRQPIFDEPADGRPMP